MARLIHIADSKGRDANVLFSGKPKKTSLRFCTIDGDTTNTLRVVKTTLNGSYEKLIAHFGDDTKLGQELIVNDPELDLLKTGMFIDGANKVFVDANFLPCATVKITEKVFDTTGNLKEERVPKELLGNILEEAPIKPSGKLFPKSQVYNRFIFSKKYQLSHVNGLTFDFLFELAKELHEKDSMMLVGTGEKGIGPLVFQDGGKTYRAFMEGRIKDNKYILLLHLSNLELKSVTSIPV